MNNFTYGIEAAIVLALGIAVIIYHYRDIKKDQKIMELDDEKIKSDLATKSDDELDEIIASRGSSEKSKT